ncbi:uncharacterized protein OCT59_023607 [Rhizophagus irregularis]|uniref:Transposase Tc1-like domain-containing protein n=1 Tax=Rhizophagus irregularis (strain DAOM 197198w) TaxID=1432141 RepID=A0A015MZ65_RHIIW|nr:hypothetical protein RirG_072640 [Rhizophagus irregularis DAOM 197198w]UZO03198.1 hypothetical protein OCT59_023607 [Rhizophagus irregularis]
MQKDFIESIGKEVSKGTVRRTRYEMGTIDVQKTSHKRKIRLFWARESRFWTINDWKKFVWSDESRFTLFQSDKKIHVWQPSKRKSCCKLPCSDHKTW